MGCLCPAETLPNGYRLRHQHERDGVTRVDVFNPMGDFVQVAVEVTEARQVYGTQPWPPPHWSVGGSR